MMLDERRQKLESFGCAPALLSGVLCQFPKKMWLYKSAPDRWSIHEIILHLADNEATSYIRCRRFIAEPDSPVLAFDSARWADALGYFHQSTREALEIIRRLRRTTYQLLVGLPDSVWLRTVEHPQGGPLILEGWLERQERHIPHHIEQMKQVHEDWLRTHPSKKPPSTIAKAGSASRFLRLSARI